MAKKLQASDTALAVALFAAAVQGAAAQTAPQSEPPARRAALGAPSPGLADMERRWGETGKSGVTESGPQVDLAAINAPTVAPGYKVPRMADGHPDITGVWSNASNTALRRPPSMKNLVMTDDEAFKARASNPDNIRQATDDHQGSKTAYDGKDLQSGRGYNSFWIDPGNNYAMVKGTWRTSWIVEPANGQLPLKPGARPAPARLGNGYDNPEERTLSERCIILNTSGPPIGNFVYNNNVRIVQSPDFVVIESEMIHDARIIPLGGQHRPADIMPWMGDSVGHWDGDTLVVETVNMQKPGPSIPISPTGKITERFTRYNDKQVFYEFEVNDPATYTQVWKGQMSLTESPGIYEYACHEGNYGLHDILSGGRTNDRRGVRNGAPNDREE